ncbi:MAG: helix-turn-helix domain-containing protein [Bacteroidales bacterium]
MTAENYLWYSKTILLMVTTIIFLGILLRWKVESKIHHTLAYLFLMLTVVYTIDLIFCTIFKEHPIIIKSGSSFGTLFIIHIIVSFSYLYSIEIFKPIKITLKFLLLLNIPLIVTLFGYVMLSLLGYSILPNYSILELISNLGSNPFSVLWLLSVISFIIYALYANVKTLQWTLEYLSKQNGAWLIINYLLFSLAIPLGIMFILLNMDSIGEALCFIIISVIMVLIYISSFNGDNNMSVEKSQFMRVNDRLLIENITNLMEHEQLFRVKDLTTDILAQKLGISRKKLYLLLKECYNSSFTDYVNGYRLSYAKKLMVNKAYLNLSMQQILENSGFNSVKTFNKFFKAKYLVTPIKYRNSVKIN